MKTNFSLLFIQKNQKIIKKAYCLFISESPSMGSVQNLHLGVNVRRRIGILLPGDLKVQKKKPRPKCLP
jgi:hypothetical protein